MNTPKTYYVTKKRVVNYIFFKKVNFESTEAFIKEVKTTLHYLKGFEKDNKTQIRFFTRVLETLQTETV